MVVIELLIGHMMYLLKEFENLKNSCPQIKSP